MPKTKRKKGGQLSRAARIAHELNTALDTDVRLGSDPYFEIVRIPTGSLVIDRITGGGFALGRHVELFGDESSCKSYIVYKTMALSQERGNLCALVDPEHSFDSAWFDKLGGRSDELLLHQPDNAEDAIAVMMMLAKHAESGDIEVIGIDSVSSLVPGEEVDKDPREEPRIAGQARMMSRALRRITVVNKKTLFLWINQERTNVGIKFGNPKTTSGGKALRFYATTRIELRKDAAVRSKRSIARSGKLVERDIIIGRWIQARAEKEKSTRPHREGSFIFDTEHGEIDEGSEILQLGLEDRLITRSGNKFRYLDIENKEYSGLEGKFKKYLKEDEDLRDEIISVIQDNTVRMGRGETDQ